MNHTNQQDVLIRCNDLGKRFCRDLKRSLWYGVEDMTRDFMGLRPPPDSQDPSRPRLRPQEFWAVDDISFEVRRGQCLGLIGKNGAGKTTILKMLGGLIKPDRGTIELHGRVGGLIALGAGFNPLLTGRENTFVNGAILGLSRHQISAKMDEIEAFADIGEFMDAPVQSYSSGMSVRLGFAIAAILTKPDVLLLDEVLAVGDMGFTIKCLNAVRELAATSAVIFVSHNMQFVSTFCTDVMVLKKGRIQLLTPEIGDGIRTYMDCFDPITSTTGTGEAKLNSIALNITGGSCLTEKVDEPIEVPQGKSLELSLEMQTSSHKLPVELYLYIMDQTMNPVVCYPSIQPVWQTGEGPTTSCSIRLPLGKIELNAGRYSFVVSASQIGIQIFPSVMSL
jgi:lipopolysaccharide transport system ATP-binding protein